MAPLPENNTARVFLDYTSAGIEHTLMLRVPDFPPPDPVEYAETYANIFAQRMQNVDSFFGARYSEVGTNFSLPIAFTPVQGVLSGFDNVWVEDPESAFISLVGRGTTTGRRVRWEFFTPIRTTTWPSDNRYNPGDAAPIDTLRLNFENAATNSSATPLFSIGRDFVSVYGYVNVAKSAYWQREQR